MCYIVCIWHKLYAEVFVSEVIRVRNQSVPNCLNAIFVNRNLTLVGIITEPERLWEKWKQRYRDMQLWIRIWNAFISECTLVKEMIDVLYSYYTTYGSDTSWFYLVQRIFHFQCLSRVNSCIMESLLGKSKRCNRLTISFIIYIKYF